MKHSELEIVLLRRGVSKETIQKFKCIANNLPRQRSEHPIVKVERLRGKPYHRRVPKKPLNQRVSPVIQFSGGLWTRIMAMIRC